MKQIPFNLERCIAGEDVITRDGNDYVFGAYNGKMAWPIIGWIGGFSISHMADGRRCKDNRNSAEDLFMKPEKITGWIYVEPSLCFLTKDDALSSADRLCPKNTALIKIEYYKGENLD